MENGDMELGDVSIIQDTVKTTLDQEDVSIIQATVKKYFDHVRNSHTNSSKPLISDSPTLRNLGNYYSKPRVVAIGLVCRGYTDDRENKFSYLIKLMSRVPSTPEETLNSCLQKVYASMEKINACYYTELRESSYQYEVALSFVADACFILEFINQISNYDKSYRGNMLPEQSIVYDLVLLENQIPFFVLDLIFQCTVLKYNPNISLVEFLRPLLNLANIFKADIDTSNIQIDTTHHILSLLHQCYKPNYVVTSTFVTSTIQSALDLDRAGVNIKPNRNPKWLMGMDVRFPCFSWFWGKPTLRMPVLHVHDFTELVLRNLIEYELHSSQTCKYITSYAYAMNMLVNTQNDVAKLVDSGVLVNNMGSNEEATKMINNLCKEVAREHFFYGEEWEKLNNYCNRYWPKNLAWLKRTYFNSPWNIIALIAGIILFALTVVQTVFSIKSA